MTFSDVNASYCDLRDALRSQVGSNVIGDVNIRPPAGCTDEGSFLRLTAWCYAYLFEAGRVCVPFLLTLQHLRVPVVETERHEQTRRIVQHVRTYFSHNLGFNDDHDLDIRKTVSSWFLATCAAAVPDAPQSWELCFNRLCDDVQALSIHCNRIFSAVAASSLEDRKMVFDDLITRITRHWEGHRFDRLVEDAAARMGERINARNFRERRMEYWRRYMSALPLDVDPRVEMERVIDGEVAEHFRSRLPVRAEELMRALDLNPGPQVKLAIDIAKRAHDEGLRGKEQIIERVRKEFALPN